ncbi:hypothetical protein NMG60_11018898 [Bertholletia excelsa]
MDIVSSTYLKNLRRCLRRRKYQRLEEAAQSKKPKNLKLGRKTSSRVWRIRLVPKLPCRLVSPIKLLARFHDAYVDMMSRMLVGNNLILFVGKQPVLRGRRVPAVAATNEDGKLVVEIDKHLASSRELATLLV